MPTFSYTGSVTSLGNGDYKINSGNFGYSGSYYVVDTDDGSGDDTTVLGDVTPDYFSNNGADAWHFVGATDNGEGFVAALNSNGHEYLFTQNGSYQSNDPFHATPGATFSLVCFATGTTIKTARGEIAVEDLMVDEPVVTASGALRPIRWIGHRRIDCAHHPRPKDVWPVLVEAGALGNNTPARDLYMTPFHAVAMTCGSDVLVPIHCLINGTTIRQVPVGEITYWHVELETHDILVANGARAESYLDTGNRAGFENAVAVVQLHPSFEAGRGGMGHPERSTGPLRAPAANHGAFCLPMIDCGPVVTAIRASLAVGARATA